MYTATKKFKFEGAHVLDTSYSKECQNIHGHSYEVEVSIGTRVLNDDGMVMDFKELKNNVAPIFDDFDHALLLGPESSAILVMKNIDLSEMMGWKVLHMDVNPTAEHMAIYFFHKIEETLPDNVGILEVKVHETRTGAASFYYEKEDHLNA